jgi:hypothetical protein
MKAQIKAKANLIVEVEGDTQTELFEALARGEEVFSHAECGYCKNTNISFVVREDQEGNNYYELHCKDLRCRARLPFGVAKSPKGSMYPKRRFDSLSPTEKIKRADEEGYAKAHGGYLNYNGWYKYKPDPNKKEKGE